MSTRPDEHCIRIVLAEDHDVVRAALRTMLNATPGLEVIGEARDGMEAVLQAHELQPDVIVMDISMPVLDGMAATQRVRAECPDVRVLVLTALEDPSHLRRLLGLGAAGYIVKRAPADELVRAIRTAAAGGAYVDPQIAGNLLRRNMSATASAAAAAELLSDREETVLRRLAWGEGNKEIARALGVSTKTVETYRARIADKLGIRTRPELVRFAVRQGWLRDD